MSRIAIIPGDGIGLEVTREAVRVLEAATSIWDLDLELVHWDLGADRFLETGVTITDEEFDRLSNDHDAILLGALGDPRVPGNEHARDILLGCRFKLDLYVNWRPAVLMAPRFTPLKGFENGERTIHLDIFRENTEGIYVNLGGQFKQGTPDEVAIQEDLNTWKGVERIIRAAFEFARDKGRSKVTLVDKANAMPAAGKLWRRAFAEVGAEFAGIEQNAMYVDAMAMDLVRRPERYEVIVTGNLFGDILSDLAAELTGGLGMAPSANMNPGHHALYEPVHGSAPDIAGQGIANPLGAIACAGLVLDQIGCSEGAKMVDDAIRASLQKEVSTPDLGGVASTEEVGAWIAATLLESTHNSNSQTDGTHG